MPATESPLTLSQLIRFFERHVEPRFSEINSSFARVSEKFDHVDQRFNDLYKKFEDLRQEYIFANEQIRRLSSPPTP